MCLMNKFIPRLVTPKLDRLMSERQIIVITGMRQVGKTTQIKYLYKKIKSANKLWLTLEDVLVRKIFNSDSYQDVKRSLEDQGIDFDQQAYIFIDEIQFAKNLPSIIKYFYDEYEVKFVVTGSSSYYLKNHFTESLAGRKIVQELYPLTFQEFLKFKGIRKITLPKFKQKAGQDQKLGQARYQRLYQEYMEFGGFPAVVLGKSVDIKREILRDILNSYFQIDVTTLANFSDIGKLRDLLTLLTQRIGQKINITNLASALSLSRTKVYEYLELLQGTYVIKLISKKSSIDNQVSSENKLYFADIGLATIFADVAIGNKFENSVLMSLAYEGDVTYFLTKAGGEIDFILNQEVGLEAKLTPSRQDLANLKKRVNSVGLDEFYLVGLHAVVMDKLIMAWDL